MRKKNLISSCERWKTPILNITFSLCRVKTGAFSFCCCVKAGNPQFYSVHWVSGMTVKYPFSHWFVHIGLNRILSHNSAIYVIYFIILTILLRLNVFISTNTFELFFIFIQEDSILEILSERDNYPINSFYIHPKDFSFFISRRYSSTDSGHDLIQCFKYFLWKLLMLG